MQEFLSGKKTYIVAFIIAGLAAAQALGYEIPEWVYAMLGSFGLGSLRASVTKSGQ